MTDSFNKLYSQFLNGNTDRERFKDFKESLNRLPDTELSQKMEKFWLENENYPAMDIQHKQNIHKKLHEQIMPQQKKTFMYWLSYCCDRRSDRITIRNSLEHIRYAKKGLG